MRAGRRRSRAPTPACGLLHPFALSERHARHEKQMSLVWRATVPLSDCLGTTLLGSWRSRGARGIGDARRRCGPGGRCAGVTRCRDLLRAAGPRCRARGRAPPSRTTRMDTSSTGPDMSWERDVRVHNYLHYILHSPFKTETHTRTQLILIFVHTKHKHPCPI